jgi:hypothetical protein
LLKSALLGSTPRATTTKTSAAAAQSPKPDEQLMQIIRTLIGKVPAGSGKPSKSHISGAGKGKNRAYRPPAHPRLTAAMIANHAQPYAGF